MTMQDSKGGKGIDRRQFLQATAVVAGATAGVLASSAAPTHAAPARKITKALKYGMINGKDANGKELSVEERLQIAADAGFDSVEPGTIGDAKDAEVYRKAAEKAGIKLDAIVCSAHWKYPLSDPDPAVWQETMKSMRTSMQNAKDIGGDMVLLVPAVVNPNVRYGDAWTRSVERVKMLAEDADRIGITIGIENVWNKFLLSPLEAKHYIEEIGSPRVRAWFDVGNVVLFGYPQDWIRTLGPLIARVDVKGFDADKKEFVPLQDGTIDWAEVMRAFDEVGYQGVMAAEVQGGDLDYLREMVSKRMDNIISMA